MTSVDGSAAATPPAVPGDRSSSAGAVWIITIYVALSVWLLSIGRRDYPNLHTILDTVASLLSGVLAWFLWDMGRRVGRTLPQLVAVGFAVTGVAELIHVVVNVESFDDLGVVATAADELRPITWPAPMYLLPFSILAALAWRGRTQAPVRPALLLLLAADGILLTLSFWLPRYTPPGPLGITRPTLIGVPLLWAAVALAGARLWRADRILPPLVVAAVVSVTGHAAMLYSQAPHDTQAMVAHLARFAAYLIPLMALTRLASRDMLERFRAETALAALNAELEVRVRHRTGELESANVGLEAEVRQRELAELRGRRQVDRLNLLHQITRAIGERADLASIYQIVLRTLDEQLGFDFGCVCSHDQSRRELEVLHLSARHDRPGGDLGLREQSRIALDANGLSRCVSGELVYEADVAKVQTPFPVRLAAAGLRSFVAAPLRVESRVFGVFILSRQAANGFTSGECEFLRQLSEHVALAANQAQLHTALQHAYDELRQTQQAIMQQERLRVMGQMASGIAHDINNAISPVALYAGAVLEDEKTLTAQSREYLATIQRAIGDVAQTVARLSEFYRQREADTVLTLVDLNAVAEKVRDLTRARWSDLPQRHGVVIDLQTSLEPSLPAITAAESEIRDALVNIVFNGIDAMPSGGVLTIRTASLPAAGELPARVRVDVTDTGVGMDEAARARCTEPFFTTKGERGTGLGLAMVHGVAERHRAVLEIDSVVGHGTTVRLTFPAVVAATAKAARAAGAGTWVSLNILLVDDEPLVLRVLCNILERDGHRVQTANGGQEGIDALRDAIASGTRIDVVVTDLGMPRVDGHRVASEVKALSPSTPVILLTGWGHGLGGDSMPHVDRVLSKPPMRAELRDALATFAPASEPPRSSAS